jgi:hypothetical protein
MTERIEVFKKAVAVLEKGLTKEELVKLAEHWDNDSLHDFFATFNERMATTIAPELYSIEEG